MSVSNRSTSKGWLIYNPTATFLTPPVKPETVMGELAPAGSLSGIATGAVLPKRLDTPTVPVASRNVRVLVVWSHLTSKDKITGVPQTKFGLVLMLKGTRLVPPALLGKLG